MSPLSSVLMTFFLKRNPVYLLEMVLMCLKYMKVFYDSDKLLKIRFSLFKMFKKEDLNSEFIVQCKRKCFSSSIHLQCEHKRCSLGIFKCLPFSINRLCSLILSFVISFLYSNNTPIFFVRHGYGNQVDRGKIVYIYSKLGRCFLFRCKLSND
jgi:hypothetical protein